MLMGLMEFELLTFAVSLIVWSMTEMVQWPKSERKFPDGLKIVLSHMGVLTFVKKRYVCAFYYKNIYPSWVCPF